MLLVGSDSFSLKNYLDKNSTNNSNVNILGGTGAVKDSVINYLIGETNEAEFYYNRGKEYAVNKDYDKSIADFSKAIELNPDDYVSYYDRALDYEHKNDVNSAILDYSRSIDINPDFIYAYNNRGFMYDRKKEYDKALADYNKAIELDPESPVSYYNRGFSYELQKNVTKAIEDYKKVLSLDPNMTTDEGAYAASHLAGLVAPGY
jgi:tetratricopeptide (TPR) repeat protein